MAVDIIISLFSRSVFDNVDLLNDGLPGALVTALILGVHEISHVIVAKEAGIKLGVPYFVPSWQVWTSVFLLHLSLPIVVLLITF